MITPAEARMRILAPITPVGTETVALAAAWSRVLAAPVVARRSQPPTAVSSMDGWAVRSTDAVAGARLRRIGTAPAGHPFGGSVGPGETVRLFTGSVLPAGADAVVMQEDATEDDGGMIVGETARTGQHIRPAGHDFAAGETLLAAGRRLSSREVGLAAAANYPWLTVYRRVRVAILATGDEIALPGEPLPPGGIVSSNAHALAAMVHAAGGEPSVLPVARDDKDSISAIADQMGGFDMLLTSGGVSVGEYDLVLSALADRGLEVDFWKIAIRPGRPLMYGRLGTMPVLGLPGNPVSALVCAVLFAMPAIAVLGGQPVAEPLQAEAVLGIDLPANGRREDYLRATLDAGVVTPHPVQDSAMLSVLAHADVLLLRPPNAPAAAAGTRVTVLPLTLNGL